jgi:hypothetical protein
LALFSVMFAESDRLSDLGTLVKSGGTPLPL